MYGNKHALKNSWKYLCCYATSVNYIEQIKYLNDFYSDTFFIRKY